MSAAASHTKPTLYILYNADASVLGKLKYGYRKISCPKDAPPECAACDITHGGLSLKETPAWLEARRQLEGPEEKGVRVVQWHRDEMSSELKSWFESGKLSYPAAVHETEPGQFSLVASKEELAECKGDAQNFVGIMRKKEVVPCAVGGV
ncbi:hypothetical protein MKZ38_001412 [Zalerion maritima]|uniref:Uncharacterized protein n=1 Tax=Zalerion maritima TaxID=339359 RepID=A0AAD5RXT9_9PEZI|nr:hypothetical protein MKZ38_001412 [Zalerion maritima]